MKADLVDVGIVCLIIYILWVMKKLEAVVYSNKFMEGQTYNAAQTFMLNAMWYTDQDTFRFDFILAGLVALLWFKLLFMLRVFSTFGPIFKIITAMMADLAKFAGLWVLIQSMFISIAMLLFAEITTFKTLKSSATYFVQASIGSWDITVFEGTDANGNPLVSVNNLGTLYLLMFVILNVVVLLNFVIAVLSNELSVFEE